MEFRINPREINNIFAVPASVVDEDLRLAGSAQLKTLLWTLRHAKHENANVDELAKELRIDRADVIDAMQFWVDRGVLVRDDDEEAAPRVRTTSRSANAAYAPAAPAAYVQAPSVPVAYAQTPAAPAAYAQTPVVPAAYVHTSAAPVAYAQTTAVSASYPSAQLPQGTNVSSAQTAVSQINIEMPSHEQVAARCNESRDLRDLFSEVQQRLGRTIGYEGQAALLMLYDTYGLSPEVILMAVEWSVMQGKTGMKYIAAVGKGWAENEIDTVEKAVKYIEDMDSCDRLWRRFSELSGISNPKPTAKQRKFFSAWTQELEYGIDIIYMAYEEMADHTEKFSMPYMDKVLRSWHAEGYRNTDDVENAKLKFAQGKRTADVKQFPGGKNKKEDASYDLDSHDQKAKLSPPTYTRRKKDS